MKTEQTPRDALRRAQLREDLRQIYEQSLDQRIDRYLEIDHQGIIGGHYFAAASSECIDLYRDGHFISAVMASQAVNEGILKFVAERNSVICKEHDKIVEALRAKGFISAEFEAASTRIWGSFRNDVHHMNPKVASIPFRELTKRNLQDLALIEKEIFGETFSNDGKLILKQPKYWDHANGKVSGYLRLE